MNYFHSLYNAVLDDYKKYNSKWAISSLDRIKNDVKFNDKKTNVVHFVMDSEYINKFILNYKSSDNGDQHFLIFSNSNIQMIDSQLIKNSFCHIVSMNISGNNFFLDNKSINIIKNADIIVIHFLFWFYPIIIKKLNNTASIWWEVWGGDYLHYLIDDYIDPINMEIASYYDIDLSVFNPRKMKLDINTLDFIKNDVDYFFGFKMDYQIFHEKHNLRAIFIETTIPNPTELKITHSGKKKSRFIIGNSFNPTNNHFSAVLFLSQSGYDGDVYIISSYGYSDAKYKKSLEDFSRSAFGERVFFVDKYMKPKDYQCFMSESQGVIFNHIRSQGSSTALTAIYNKTNLYACEDSSLIKQYVAMCTDIINIDGFVSKYKTSIDLNYKFIHDMSYDLKLFFKDKEIVRKVFSN